MKAIAINEFGPAENFTEIDVEKPEPLHNDAVVKIDTVGLNRFDIKMRAGWLQPLFKLPLPLVCGWDVAGVVDSVGFDVYEFQPGDRVFGMASPTRWGGAAEYATITVDYLRAIPAGMSMEEAAVLPMAGQTAWHGLVELAGVKAGDRVLVHAGSGGVGSLAIQVAKAHGAWVATTCSGRNVDYVESLGADAVINYETSDFSQELKDIDIALDVLGGDVIKNTYKVMRPGGKILAVLRYDAADLESRAELSAKYNVDVHTILFSNRPAYLEELAQLHEAGKLAAPVTQLIDFSAPALTAAHQLLESERTRGKLAMKIA